MVTSGSRSATTASNRLRRYNPGVEFQYQFDANRTFSSHGTRPVSSPARLKLSRSGSRRRSRNPSPADIIALAQSPSPDFLQESFGRSLMMLQQGYRKVSPSKFLDLEKASNRLSPMPLSSPRSEISTPRLAKNLVERLTSPASESFHADQASKATQYDYRSNTIKTPASASKRPSTVGDVVVAYIKQTPPKKGSGIWSRSGRENGSQRSYSQVDAFAERCVRCSEFPEIQIEGRSLSRILTNQNTLMAKEHCEILGPESCPDCIKTRSQKQHEQHCMKNTPAIANDVYKLALVHEKAPHLNMREVQRKVFDGEISDNVLNVSKWPESMNSPALLNPSDVFDATPLMDDQISRPDPFSAPSIRPPAPAMQSSRSFLKSNPPAFETIPEIAETLTDSEEEGSLEQADAPEHDDAAKEMTFRRHKAESLEKIKLIPPQERLSSAEVRRNLIQDGILSSKNDDDKEEEDKTSVSVDNIVPTSQLVVRKVQTTSEKQRRQIFTRNLVPSGNFFFDIADLAKRLRTAEVSERLKKQKEAENFLKALAAAASPQNENGEKNEADTGSVDSDDSNPRITEFNMAYEPPVLFENKGRYLGIKAPPAGTRASAAKIAG
ncbi:uncharacterized protein LOC143460893 isoform X1 [Clavelina lepadiformis]|uniref:uncharacterized protein LOC143460893 isoform X1 n=1 Tax=Clavelina lepadiformis TaxID=159417 RepID=UPI004042FEEB